MVSLFFHIFPARIARFFYFVGTNYTIFYFVGTNYTIFYFVGTNYTIFYFVGTNYTILMLPHGFITNSLFNKVVCELCFAVGA